MRIIPAAIVEVCARWRSSQVREPSFRRKTHAWRAGLNGPEV